MAVHDQPLPDTDAAPAASHARDAEIADHIRTHHASMVADLDRLSETLRDATAPDQERARTALQDWFRNVLVPHADEEEATTYRAAAELSEGRLLIAAMVREHVLIKRLVALVGDSDVTSAAAYGRAVFEAFSSHQAKENDVVLPLLVDAPGVSLAHVMGDEHGHQLGEHHHHAGPPSRSSTTSPARWTSRNDEPGV
ncbi:MAG: hemerythrin domain-containing protein [Terrabacter sp.]